jgi:cytochrome c oxidase cbb3-type subunit 1
VDKNSEPGALGGIGGIFAPVLHSGGMVGNTASNRMIPALAFVVNMLMTMKDKWYMFTQSIPLQWALTGVLFAIPLNIQGAFQQTRALNWYIHGSHWIVAHAHLALLGFSSFIEIGAIYYGLPKLLKRELGDP